LENPFSVSAFNKKLKENTMVKKFEILSPHVDDEVIGCFRLLENGEVEKVHYFFELTIERRTEAMASARFFNFTPVFHENSFPKFDSNIHILIPNINDNHIHHKILNRKYRAHPLVTFYSVDMNVNFDVLAPKEQNKKQYCLKTLFPTQKQLFDKDEKYWLFESYEETDLKLRYRRTVFDNQGGSLEIEASIDPTFIDYFRLNEPVYSVKDYVEHILNAVVSTYNCEYCKVSYKIKNAMVSAET